MLCVVLLADCRAQLPTLTIQSQYNLCRVCPDCASFYVTLSNIHCTLTGTQAYSLPTIYLHFALLLLLQ